MRVLYNGLKIKKIHRAAVLGPILGKPCGQTLARHTPVLALPAERGPQLASAC